MLLLRLQLGSLPNNMTAVQVVKRLSFGDMSLHLPEHLETQQVLQALNEPSAENFKR